MTSRRNVNAMKCLTDIQIEDLPRKQWSVEVISLLIHRRINGAYCLEYASWHNDIGSVKFLVNSGVDLYGNALRFAAEKGHYDIVKFLADNGAPIEYGNHYALRIAAQNGHESIVRYLVGMGADIHAQNDHALYLASKNGHESIVRYLVGMGAKNGHESIVRPPQKKRRIIDRLSYLLRCLMEFGNV